MSHIIYGGLMSALAVGIVLVIYRVAYWRGEAENFRRILNGVNAEIEPLRAARNGRIFGLSADGRMLSVGLDGKLRAIGTHPYPTDHVTAPEPSYARCVTVSHGEVNGRIIPGEIVAREDDGLYRRASAIVTPRDHTRASCGDPNRTTSTTADPNRTTSTTADPNRSPK